MWIFLTELLRTVKGELTLAIVLLVGVIAMMAYFYFKLWKVVENERTAAGKANERAWALGKELAENTTVLKEISTLINVMVGKIIK